MTSSRITSCIAGTFVVAILLGIVQQVAGQTGGASNDGKGEFIQRNGKLCFSTPLGNLDADKVVIKAWIDSADIKNDPPIAGTVLVVEKQVVFEPRFALRKGKEYFFQVTQNGVIQLGIRIVVPRQEEQAPATVTGIYPSADVIPENHLRFYVQFSAPMRKGNVYEYIKLRELGGEAVELPFLEIEQEFWSRDSKRLTILFDPGRVKRGLKPREEMGPILVAGKSYQLHIAQEWPDANGNPLNSEMVKTFKAGPEDKVQPDPANWTVVAPTSGSKDPLVVKFPQPLDHAMLRNSIAVLNRQKNLIDGTIKISANEMRWEFTPHQIWSIQNYMLEIGRGLEDSAGNSIGRKFDVDIFTKTEKPNSDGPAHLEFEVK